ncbi:MAG: c-type cytochrome [Janthinobacterium lividum]
MARLGLSTLVIAIGLAGLGSARAQDAPPVRPGDPVVGEDVFVKCSGCHQVGVGAQNSIGPELNGIAGRTSGTVPGYDYSSALKAANIRWTHDELAAFEIDATAVVPKTKMSFAGLKSRQDVEDLTSYLSQFDDVGNVKAQ